MTAQIIDGKALAEKMKAEIKVQVSAMPSKPGLAVVLIGTNAASQTYVNMKKKACTEAGIISFSYELPETTSEAELLALIEKLNHQNDVHGILVQLPIPKHVNSARVLEAITPKKDVDGFHPMTSFLPCTPAGIMELIDSTGMNLNGKKAVVVGRSHIVGKPTATLLLDRNATVTICHRHTVDLGSETRQADVMVAAVGVPRLIKGDMIKAGAVVIDVGINRVDGKLVGDVDFEEANAVAGYLTPVPGGVGPMTIAMLLHNTFHAAKHTFTI